MTTITLLCVTVTDCDTGVESSSLFNIESIRYYHYNVEGGLLKGMDVFTISYDSEKLILNIPSAVFDIAGKILSYILDCTSLDITLEGVSVQFY